MKQSGPLKRTGSLKRTGEIKRTGALSPVSAKRRKLNRERRPVVAALRAKTPTCEARPLLRAALVRMTTAVGQAPYLEGLRDCRVYGPLVGHEPQKRSRRGSIVDPDNILMVCNPCNAWCEIHVAAATEAGLLVPSSFEKDRA